MNDRIISCKKRKNKGTERHRGDRERLTETDEGGGVVGLDFEAELFQGNKDETPLLCFSLSLSFSVSLFSVIWRPGWNYDNKRKEKLLLWLLSHYVNDIKQALCVCNVWASGVYASLSSQVHMHGYTFVHGVMFVPPFVCMCVLVWLFVHAWACLKWLSPNVHMCERVCPGAMGANLHTVITRCQTPPHWLWHVNYTPCFHLLWWHNTHIKRCTVLVWEFVCARTICMQIIAHLTEKQCTRQGEHWMSELGCLYIYMLSCRQQAVTEMSQMLE